MEERFQLIADKNNNRLDYFLGMNRIVQGNINAEQTTSNLHSLKRQGGIQDRIRRAEAAEADPAAMERRKNEYNSRINSLLKSEQEIVKDPEQQDAI